MAAVARQHALDLERRPWFTVPMPGGRRHPPIRAGLDGGLLPYRPAHSSESGPKATCQSVSAGRGTRAGRRDLVHRAHREDRTHHAYRTNNRVPDSSAEGTAALRHRGGPRRRSLVHGAQEQDDGRITTTGAVTEYAVPQGYPTAITASADGTLSFSSIFPSGVNRIAPDGSNSQYPLTTSFDKPGGIAAGPDGAVWFTIYSADKIARIARPPDATTVSRARLP